MNTKRFGILGCGRMGQRRAEAISGIPGATVRFVSDLSFDAATALANKHSCRVVDPSNLEDFVDDIDCIVISTPNSFHKQQCLLFIENGIHVFCEKPLAVSCQEAREIAARAAEANVRFQVGSNVRHFGNVQRARDLLLGGKVGKLLFARGWIGHDGWVLKNGWSGDPRRAGGGALLDNGCHMIDLIRWNMGEIESVLGRSATLFSREGQGVEDNFMGILNTSKGLPVMFQCSWTEWSGYLYMEFYGESGSVVIDSRLNKSLTRWRDTGGHSIEEDYSSEGAVSFRREMEAFTQAIDSRSEPSPNAGDGARVLEIIDALYESSRTNTLVRC
jgi:predicted dehydrogenase